MSTKAERREKKWRVRELKRSRNFVLRNIPKLPGWTKRSATSLAVRRGWHGLAFDVMLRLSAVVLRQRYSRVAENIYENDDLLDSMRYAFSFDMAGGATISVPLNYD